MASLVYTAITSLDGYVNDVSGNFDWAAPDDEVHAFVNELERPIGTYIYGRRLYDVMKYWATEDPEADRSAAMRDYRQIWQAAHKVVFSASLDAVSTPDTRLERAFDPAAVAELKAGSRTDISIGGPTLAAAAFRAQLIDTVHLFLHPVAVGGGTPALPRDARVDLELVDERRFAGGVVHLHYRTRSADR